MKERLFIGNPNPQLNSDPDSDQGGYEFLTRDEGDGVVRNRFISQLHPDKSPSPEPQHDYCMRPW
jgi:hypothetical protein